MLRTNKYYYSIERISLLFLTKQYLRTKEILAYTHINHDDNVEMLKNTTKDAITHAIHQLFPQCTISSISNVYARQMTIRSV